MKLKEYLKQVDEPLISFAQKIGVSYSTVWRIYNEKFTPELPTALKIVEETGGKVTAKDLIVS